MALTLTPGQRQFAGTLSRETGLGPKVVASWLYAEQNGSAAQGYQDRGYHNWLNIANTDSGPAGGAHSSVWRNPVSAARATAQWLKGQGPIAHEYGAPAQGIREILKAAGRDPMAQIQAIANSPWASSHYNGGSTLRSIFSQLGNVSLPAGGSESPSGPFGGVGQGSGPGVQTNVSEGAPDLSTILSLVKQISGPKALAANAQIAAPATTARPTMPNGAKPIPGIAPKSPSSSLLPLLEQALAGGTRNVESTVTPGSPGAGYEPAHVQGGPLAGLLPAHAMLKLGRIDEGQDGQTNPGGAIVANGSFKVVAVKSDPTGFGPSYPIVVFSSGPLAGKGPIYFGHTLSALKPGQSGRAGTVISHTGRKGVGNATTPGWFEIGLANTLGQGNRGQGASLHGILSR